MLSDRKLLIFIYLKTNEKNYSILSIFPYFVLGFVGMIVLRNVGDEIFSKNDNWIEMINWVKASSKILLTMAMAAVGISINLSELKSMGYKPFVVGLIAAITVGFISLIYIETLIKFI